MMPAQEGCVGLVPAKFDQFLGWRLGLGRGIAALLSRKVSAVPRLEFWKIGRHQVDLAADRFGLAGLEPTDSKVGMKANDHTLKQLLIRRPRHRHQLLAVGRDAADQPIGRHDFGERSRVDVLAADPLGAPDLSRRVERIAGPGFRGQKRPFASGVDETSRQIGLAGVLGLRARIAIDPHARLGPVGLGWDVRRIGRDNPEIHHIAAGSNFMIDQDAVGQLGPKLDPSAVTSGRDDVRLVGNNGLLPISPCGTRTTECLDIPDLESSAGEMLASDGQDLIVPRNQQGSIDVASNCRRRQNSRQPAEHDRGKLPVTGGGNHGSSRPLLNRRDSTNRRTGSTHEAIARPIKTPMRSVIVSATLPSRLMIGRF